MPKIISFINLKGGVGKTTTSVNIAATLAATHNKKVLLIDLDPQTNATVCLITQPEWQEIHNRKQTLFHLFEDMLRSTTNFKIKNAIVKNVSEIKGLDLLPSSLEFVNIQDEIPEISNKEYVSHVDILGNAISNVKDEYDYIIIDCPPNLGAITLNGINISDYYIVPTIPDILSIIGIDLITNRIDVFKAKKNTCKVSLAGIIFTKVDYRTNLHNSKMAQLRQSKNLKNFIFKNEIPQRTVISEAPVDSRPLITSPTAKKKQEWRLTLDLFTKVTNELVHRIS
ncbi:ParA family protein [Aeromonas hydrophila]|uniref:ParA family protein n=1 Tax=Aeromonas hydrophila TaxID=644 RepID=UPI0009B8EE9F|nr:AAA family ATPase [Aeromonas hydrophila]